MSITERTTVADTGHVLSVVVPLRDEEDNVLPLVTRVQAALASAPWPWQLILADDGSRDGTGAHHARRALAGGRAVGAARRLGAWLGLALHARWRWRTTGTGGLLARLVLIGVAADLLVSRHIGIPAVLPAQRVIGAVCLAWGGWHWLRILGLRRTRAAACPARRRRRHVVRGPDRRPPFLRPGCGAGPGRRACHGRPGLRGANRRGGGDG